ARTLVNVAGRAPGVRNLRKSSSSLDFDYARPITSRGQEMGQMPSVAFEPQVVPEPPVWPQSVVTVGGNPPPGSRTAAAAASVAELLASELGTPYRLDELVDLVTFAPAIFQGEQTSEGSRAALENAVELVSSASVVVVATPVYKGSYTGLLKSF